MNKLYIVNYCNPNCSPLYSITRLPECEAFAAAKKLSSKYTGTAFGRFADFENYYPRRIRAEEWLYKCFIDLGGEPATKHPLYFVLHGSDYLNEWFGRGKETKLPLDDIDSKHISFTFGDSMSKKDHPEQKGPVTKEDLYNLIGAFSGTIDEFLAEAEKKWNYIEVQLWDDSYCGK